MARKRKMGEKREPNGRLSRKQADVTERFARELDQAERDTIRPGLDARVNLFGVRPEDSRSQMAGCFVGRLCLAREISTAQYEAAMTFLEDHRNNAIAIRAPREPSGVDLNRVQGGTGERESVSFYRRATSRWRAAVCAVQDRQNQLRGQGALYAALEYCVLRDVDAYHMLGWLREGLNALARHYAGDNARAA